VEYAELAVDVDETLFSTTYRSYFVEDAKAEREKLIKIGAEVVRHAKAVTFQLAEVAVPRALFAAILGRIGRLRAAPSPG
jgi:hypothetical protein